MEITEVRIKLMEGSEDRLRGFCSITFDDCFVVRDLKIIEGNNGPFVAMPSRKLTSHCKSCRTKNHLRARFCNNCGARLKSGDLSYDSDGRAKLYADIAHPVNAACREMIQNRVIKELEKETELSRMPGYKSRYDDDYEPRNRSRNDNARTDDPIVRQDGPEAKRKPHQPPENTISNEARDSSDESGDNDSGDNDDEQQGPGDGNGGGGRGGPSGDDFGKGIFG